MSVINEYGEGGLKMIDLETMVKSLRLAWLKRMFNGNDGTWKRYLKHQLKSVGGLFFINCNYDVNDYTVSSQILSRTFVVVVTVPRSVRFRKQLAKNHLEY